MSHASREAGGWPLTALLLWALTLAWVAGAIGSGERMVGGTDPEDAREAIGVGPGERRVVHEAMNENLVAVHQILLALGDDQVAEAARLADRAAHTPGPGRRSESLEALLPQPWRRLGKQVHKELARFAKVARRGASRSELVARLSRVTQACVDCHNRYRLVPADEGRLRLSPILPNRAEP